MQSNYRQAQIYIDRALENDTARSAVIVEHAGDIYARNQDMKRALELWKEALEKSPERKILSRKIKLKKYIKE
jgi:predicted negative regulator of RcsB-dependent stress response